MHRKTSSAGIIQQINGLRVVLESVGRLTCPRLREVGQREVEKSPVSNRSLERLGDPSRVGEPSIRSKAISIWNPYS